MRPRSGLAVQHGLTVLNAPGTIDADYRGEIRVPLVHLGHEPVEIRRGDRIAQLVIAPVTVVDWALDGAFDDTARGGAGFDGLDWTPGPDGAPVISGTLARFDCRLHAAHDGGDHVILVGQVARASLRDGTPLLFSQGQFGRFAR